MHCIANSTIGNANTYWDADHLHLHHGKNILYTGSDSVSIHSITVTPVSLQTALLQWNITPSNVIQCIPSYTIECISDIGTVWRTETPNSRLSCIISDLKCALEYNCSITAASGSSARVAFTIEQQGLSLCTLYDEMYILYMDNIICIYIYIYILIIFLTHS